MLAGIIAGIVAGFIGFVPLLVAHSVFRKKFSADIMQLALYALAGVCVSLVILIIELLICAKVAHDFVMPFGLAEIAVFLVATSVYVVMRNGFGKVNNSNRKEG